MKEIQAIITKYKALALTETPSVLATVINIQGSSYRRTGARMLITENGDWVGGVSGGCLEGDLMRRAKHLMLKKESAVVTYDTTEDNNHQIGVGLGCQGIIDIFLTPLIQADKFNPVSGLEEALNERAATIFIAVTKNTTTEKLKAGQLIRYKSNNQITNFFRKEISEKIIEDIAAVFALSKSKQVSYNTQEGELSLFIEIIHPPIHIVIIGSNYDIYPMANLARMLGWRVSVIAKISKLNKTIYKQAGAVFPLENFKNITLDKRTAVLAMNHDLKKDFHFLQQFIHEPVGYIGLLGPKKRGNKLLTMLKDTDESICDNKLQKIFTPTGLDIGGKTPEEIALAILAEIQAVFANRQGAFLQDRDGPIYD